jgi:tRNA (mo5U34)-methyltransferase
MAALYKKLLSRWPGNKWLESLTTLAESRMKEHPHGDLPRWRAAVEALPSVSNHVELNSPAPALGSNAEDQETLQVLLMELHPWRKGPLNLGGQYIDTEWRSDWKWDRMAPHIEISGHRILDIGCGNGYFGLRMLGAGAKLVVGVDPTILFVMQYLACRHFSGELPNYVLPLGIEDLPDLPVDFDTVFSMGVLYHRRDALHHLSRIRSLLKIGGTMVLETMVLPKSRMAGLLVPESETAKWRT